jgi:uncharacterized membrane protein YdjX (TVP38/TMEM64 family)
VIAENTGNRPARSARKSVLRVAVLVLIIAGALVAAYRTGWLDYHAMLSRVAAMRHSSNVAGFSLLFVLVYGIAGAVGMPGTPMTVAAGALFGTAQGTLLSWAGAMLSAALGYWVARRIGRGVVATWICRYPPVGKAVSEARGFGGMLRLRLLPVLPLGVVNFVEGLARAPFIKYLVATAIGVVPSTLVFAYFADSLVRGSATGWGNAITAMVVASVLAIAVTLAPRWLRPRS